MQNDGSSSKSCIVSISSNKNVTTMINHRVAFTDLVSARWNGEPVGVSGEVKHLTCRNGMKMNPDWSSGIIEATCNDNLEWELSPSVAYSCVQGI